MALRGEPRGLERSHNYRARQECQPAGHEVGPSGPGCTRIPHEPEKNNSSRGSTVYTAAAVTDCCINGCKTHSSQAEFFENFLSPSG
ncbi:hypothetical protein EYF80_056039 [Liparis tanakae]|uniref:Uncharacterized protein n=1 Tax=Liparis tanakae TaxID=230148 RepID=A0A4Z2EYF8_9TELE|nr:hypothetical protein EYF80_056039 [Liparis tanakae]